MEESDDHDGNRCGLFSIDPDCINLTAFVFSLVFARVVICSMGFLQCLEHFKDSINPIQFKGEENAYDQTIPGRYLP